MVAGGAPVVDGDFSEVYFSVGGHLIVREGKARDPMTLYYASRPFIEGHVRRRLRAVANVTILDGHDVAGLTTTAERTESPVCGWSPGRRRRASSAGGPRRRRDGARRAHAGVA